RQLLVQGLVGTDPKHGRGAQRCDHAHCEREDRLTHRQSYAGADSRFALRPEAAVLVALPAERDDYAKHGHRLVDDREGLALEVSDVVNPGLNPLRVEAGRAVDARYDAERDRSEDGIDADRDD